MHPSWIAQKVASFNRESCMGATNSGQGQGIESAGESTRSKRMTTAFISYSRKDTEFVRRLHAVLTQQGLEGWVDWEGIPPAADWLRKVHAAIEGVDAFVFLMSPDSLASAVCAGEAAHAVKHNKRIVPVVVREVNRVDHSDIEIPEALRRLNWISSVRTTTSTPLSASSSMRSAPTSSGSSRTRGCSGGRSNGTPRGATTAFSCRRTTSSQPNGGSRSVRIKIPSRPRSRAITSSRVGRRPRGASGGSLRPPSWRPCWSASVRWWRRCST